MVVKSRTLAIVVVFCGLAILLVSVQHNRRNISGNSLQDAQQILEKPPPVVMLEDAVEIGRAPPHQQRGFTLEAEQYFTDVVKKTAPAQHLQACLDVVQDKRSFSQAKQDSLMLHAFFRDLREPGVYLDIGANDAAKISNTFFFDICLGWKGVAVEPNPAYESGWAEKRTARLVKSCISPIDGEEVGFSFSGVNGKIDESKKGATPIKCRSLEGLLRDNADILGEQDSEGRWGTKINYVSFDIEGYEATVLGCANLRGLFSSRPPVQVWNIETNTLSGNQLRIMDAAMLWGGYVKVSTNLDPKGYFLDDIYLMQRDWTAQISKYLPLQRCKSGAKDCPFADVPLVDPQMNSIKCK